MPRKNPRPAAKKRLAKRAQRILSARRPARVFFDIETSASLSWSEPFKPVVYKMEKT